MSDNQYPEFESGQTLTAVDLNQLQSFLHQRDRLVGRMIGFGVNCGLGGTVSGTTLKIAPGLAVDQTGEPLVLGAEETITLPPAAETPSYDFIQSNAGGFSAVLEVKDDVVAAPSCTEVNCAGHAKLHTRTVDVRMVSGRVTGTRLDFAGETLLSVEPIRLALDSTPINSYNALRDAIATRLTNGGQLLVQAALITKLQQTSVLAGDSPGIKGYKCGWLNMVLFATLDLLRCEALMKVGCDRSTTRPGVVLGWVHEVAGNWVFDCSYRHQWEPPRGFTQALLGGTCSDPCGVARDNVEALLAGYAPPDPVPAGPVEPPVYCPKGSYKVGDLCFNFPYPGPEIYDDWRDKYLHYKDASELEKHWNPNPEEQWTDPIEFYKGVQEWNYFGDGLLSMYKYVGQPGDAVKDTVETFINGNGGIGDVRVVSPAQAQAMDGYHPSGAGSPSDVLVLSVNNAGNVVATGRVAGQRNVAKVGAALPAAEAAIADARIMTTELSGLTNSLSENFENLNTTMEGLQGSFNTLKSDFNAYKGGEFDQSGFGGRLNTLERQFESVQAQDSRISTLEGTVNVLSTRSSGVTGVGPVVGGGVISGEAIGGGAIAEFAETTLAAMKSLGSVSNPNFVRYTRDAERAHARLTVDLAGGDQTAIGHSTFELLKTVRTLVKASGADASLGRELDSQVRRIGEVGGYR